MVNRFAVLKNEPWFWLFSVYAAMLLFHGIGYTDIQDYLGISQDMTHLMSPPKRQFIYYSPLNYILADLLGIASVPGFFVLHLTEIAAMLGAVLVSVTKKFPAREDRIAAIILISLTPLWLVTLKWLGKPDPLLVGTIFLCWAYPGKWRWVLASFLVMVHRELGTFMCLFLFLSEQERDYTLVRSILLGWFAHFVYDHKILNAPPVSRVDDITIDIWKHPKEFIERPVLYFFGSLSWYWAIVLWQKPAMRLVLGLAGAFIVAMFSEDFTRDFILMVLPPLLYHLEVVVRNPVTRQLWRFAPLGLLQIQVALMGTVYKPGNFWVDCLQGHFWDQFF